MIENVKNKNINTYGVTILDKSCLRFSDACTVKDFITIFENFTKNRKTKVIFYSKLFLGIRFDFKI